MSKHHPYTVPQLARMAISDRLMFAAVCLYPKGREKTRLMRILSAHYRKAIVHFNGDVIAVAKHQEPMVYIATDPATGLSYAGVYADPKWINQVAQIVQQYLADKAVVELVPVYEAHARLVAGRRKQRGEQ